MKLSRTSKKMILMVGISALVMVVGGVVFFRSLQALYFAFGVILTSALNAGKVCLLDRTARKSLDMQDPQTGKNYVRFQYLMRYFLTGAVLLGAGLVHVYVEPPFINLWGAVAGLFTLQIAVIIVRSMKIEEDV